ncbi:NAD(P)H-binding protein [Streptomyces antimycoticus]|uniref:NAD(P)H-binding protein n=3 Tax=Streptomyces TaxID=1883 RepID=A0ABD5JDM4_9ACTN|nr:MULTISPECIES: NAD(P)H-binding protein [Streptomyces]MEE4585861.1 NAD(P)H-binding protein [Streptomyces sp. DSM 41602]AJZ84898.1 NAD(P)H-binding protein [Streptomyces sp. AgN23]KUL64982.1 NmrA family protein [Streptomyces violaceusniger]RSS33714.1 SDR family NAD(P)-dependent oxidoreductase [Streptomyces sp. WAC05858]WTA79963.1 NAD(P)H-binding protein [Streptomyces antimycoticus]
MSNDTTLVLGATGKTGRRILARLRLRGTPVRAASRSSRTRFDWSDPGGWDAALRGIAVAYVVAPRVPGPVHEFVARAEAAGVRRLVLLSGRGSDTWGDSSFGLDMRSAEDAVRGSALEWTVLRPSNFAQNFDEDVFHAPLVAGELALPAGKVPEPFIDAEDVADAAAAVLTETGRHAGRSYELTGPRALTFGEAVELISRASGRPIAYRQVSPAEYTAALVDEGVGEEDAHHVAEMFVLMERGLLAGTTDDLATVLGRAPRTFEDYVVRAAAAGAWGL